MNPWQAGDGHPNSHRNRGPAPSPTDTPAPLATKTPTPTPPETPSETSTPTSTPTSAPTSWSVVIDYTYDPVYRLSAADYSTGGFFHYILRLRSPYGLAPLRTGSTMRSVTDRPKTRLLARIPTPPTSPAQHPERSEGQPAHRRGWRAVRLGRQRKLAQRRGKHLRLQSRSRSTPERSGGAIGL
jgi:hypothetical protein